MSPHQIILFAAGSNAHGQLAIGSSDDAHKFTPCLFSEIGGTDESKLSWPGNKLSPNGHPSSSHPIVKIASGANHTLLLIHYPSDGPGPASSLLYGSGDFSKGQLPFTPTPNSASTVFRPIDLTSEAVGYGVVDIAAAWETSFFLLRSISPDKSDRLLSIGTNDFGELALGNRLSSNGGVKRRNAPAFHSIQFHHLLQPSQQRYRITSVNATIHHVIVLLDVLDTGEQLVVGWGACRHGQLGPKAISTSPTPSKSSNVKTASQAPSFLSAPTLLLARPATDLSSHIHRVALGSQHTLLLHKLGQITAWGSNRKRQLEAVSSYTDPVKDIGCTWNGTYVVPAESPSTVLATGSGEKGQLGRSGPSTSSSTPSLPLSDGLLPIDLPSTSHRVKNLACGSEHVLTLASSEQSSFETDLWAWGWNEHGNFGLGHTNDLHRPALLNPAIESSLRDAGHSKNFLLLGGWAGCGTSWVLVEVDEARHP